MAKIFAGFALLLGVFWRALKNQSPEPMFPRPPDPRDLEDPAYIARWAEFRVLIEKELRVIKKSAIVFLIVCVGIHLFRVLGTTEEKSNYSWLLGLVVAFYVANSFILYWRARKLVCPRCERPFYTEAWHGKWTIFLESHSCKNCGLHFGSKNGLCDIDKRQSVVKHHASSR